MATPACVEEISKVNAEKPVRGRHEAGVYRASGITFAANVAYLALGFLANLILVRALPPADFGTLSLALAVLIIAQEVCGGGIDVTMVRFAGLHPEDSSRIYRTAFQFKLAFNALLAAALWVGSGWIAEHVFQGQSADLAIKAAGIGALGSSLYTFLLARLQAEERFFAYSTHRVLNNALKCLILGLVWWMGLLHLMSALWITSGVFLISSALGMLWLNSRDMFAWQEGDTAVLKRVLRFGGAVVLSRILFTLYSRIDLLYLGHYRSRDNVADYSVAANMAYLIDLCAYSVILTLLPKASRLSGSRELTDYTSKTVKMCASFAALLVPLYIFAPTIITLLFSARYANSAALFRILFIGSVVTLLVHPLYLVLYARNKPEMLLFADGSLVLVSILCNSWLTPSWGPQGAAIASVAARLFGCAAILILLRRELKTPTPTNQEHANA